MTYIPPGGGGSTSDDITNLSVVPGLNVTEALDELDSRLPLIIEVPGLVVAPIPTYTTVLTIPTQASTSYSFVILVSISDGPVGSIRTGMWRFLGTHHRGDVGGAVIDGSPSILTVGNFGSMSGRVSAVGNDVLLEIRFSGGATVNARIDVRALSLTPG